MAAETEAPFALRDGVFPSRGRLWFDARELAPRLPDAPFLFNLCEDRYLFCAVLLAAMLRRQVCLLPPASKPGVLEDILRDFPGGYLACDKPPPYPPPCRVFAVEIPETSGSTAPLDFDANQTTLIAFTSGTSGQPKPCPKTWGTFKISAAQAVASLGLEQARLTVVCTTPPQHMYGLETSIFWPLFSSLAMHSGRPFFPEDIRQAVRNSPWPCLLVSTPTHLAALAKTEGAWPNLWGILSATASLPEALARHIEARTGATLREIYGSTETLSFASRAPTRETLWCLYQGANVRLDRNEAAWLESPHLEEPVLLQDRLRIEPDGRFEVLGRPEDLIKIGGKRGSLAELNKRLTEIPGVDDGVFLVREDGHGGQRTLAIVVSGLSKPAIIEALSRHLDDVFLPKRIHFVPKIPRNAVGKLTKTELDRLLAEIGARRD